MKGEAFELVTLTATLSAMRNICILGQTAIPELSIQSLASVVVNIGLAAGLVLFFVFKNDKREQKSEERIQKLEQFQKDTLMDLVKENATLLQRNAELLERCAHALEKRV
jgi:uncharacterized protein HemX